MRTLVGTLLLALVGCQRGVVYVPGPPVDPPPVVQPPAPPAPTAPPTVAAALERLEVGMTLAAATTAMGGPPRLVPAGEGAPASARWDLTDAGGATWVVYAVLDGTNRVIDKGAARVEIVR